ncbi:hypothetical protein SDC9_199944 [bioreactor metagenome]|uniref:Uncharacterized protein n=1 Tax=bioreactor metagenome TaxID=1076179 RepID=A0A645ILW9_9ZZZZ
MKPDPSAQRVNSIHQSLFVRPDEFLINSRANQRGGGITHADNVCPGADLFCREPKLHLHDKLEQIADESRVVEEIGHQRIDSAQIRCFSDGAFHPAFNDLFRADLLFEQFQCLNAIVHPSATERGWHFQAN